MKKGFSLIELAIVLVILGLMAGAILAGQSMIRNAELRAVLTEYEAFENATFTFQEKYYALPGDMPNAEDIWGPMSTGTCPNATGQVGKETCNGNGDRVIDDASAASRAGELFTFWQHLSNAGMIEGTFTGIAGSGGGRDSDIGENVPKSDLSNAGWSVTYFGDVLPANTFLYEGEYGNAMTLGLETAIDVTSTSVLTPEEAWNVDSKADDSQPGTGKIRTFEAQGADDGTGCGNAAASATLDATTVRYTLTNERTICSLIFLD